MAGDPQQSSTVPASMGVELTHACAISFHTGNVVNSNRLRRSATQSASSELAECVGVTQQAWLEGLDDSSKHQLLSAAEVQCSNERFIERLDPEERQEYKITVKIFLTNLCSSAVEDAISAVLEDLGVGSVETVILSVPEALHCCEGLRGVWRSLEAQVDAGRVYSLGISDLSKDEIEQLYNSVQVKPVINQVNLTSCCVIPQDLAEWAKERDVQLLTHNDPPVILTDEDCRTLLSPLVPPSQLDAWSTHFVARYSVLIKARGIIKSKGFVVRAARVPSA